MRPAVLGFVAWMTAAGGWLGCSGSSAADRSADPAPRPRQVIVVIDLSGSLEPHMLADGKRFLDELIHTLTFGEQVVILEMHHRSPTDDVLRWSDSIPGLQDPSFVSILDERRRDGVRQAARAVVQEFYDAEQVGRVAHTDIFSTLYVAAEYLRDGSGRSPVLLLLSDMLQSAHGIEMDGLERMPEPQWIEGRRSAGLLPRLDGLCVGVVGADATSAEGSAVRDFWSRYFTASGARLEERNYRMLGTGPDAIRCP